MGYADQYEQWILEHRRYRQGEGLRRLMEHGHAEQMFLQQVWWPAVGSFEGLVPEYEVRDFKDGYRYLDFAYLREPYRICFELDGFGPHLRDISRWQFADQLQRQNDLVSDGWKVYRFSFDLVKEHPRRCQTAIQQMMGKWFGASRGMEHLTLQEIEVVRLAAARMSGFTPLEAAKRLGSCDKTARKLLHRLLESGILCGRGSEKRIMAYKLNEDWLRSADWL